MKIILFLSIIFLAPNFSFHSSKKITIMYKRVGPNRWDEMKKTVISIHENHFLNLSNDILSIKGDSADRIFHVTQYGEIDSSDRHFFLYRAPTDKDKNNFFIRLSYAKGGISEENFRCFLETIDSTGQTTDEIFIQ